MTANGYLDAPKQFRWRLVGGRGGSTFRAFTGTGECHGIAMHLEGERCDLLIEWSEENPELAKIFWTRVVEWVRQERYGEAGTALFLIDRFKRETDEDVRKILDDAVHLA